MTLILSGSDGLSDVDGTAAAPALRGTDTNTGIFFGTDIIGFSEGGVESARFNADAQFVAAAGTAALPVITTTGDVNTGVFFPAADTVAVSTGGTERARITSGGYFKASPSGSYNDAAGSYHELRGAGANGYELVVSNTNASPASQYMQDIRFTAATPNNTNARFLACTDPTNEKAAILSTGGFLSRNNSYGTYSDIKLKENVVDASPKLDDVMRLQVRNFNFKTNPETKQIGFIAQEFEQVFPAMVDEFQDRGKDGAVLEQTTKSIKTSVLIPILVKAIQEQQALITALTTRITALEAA
jgi:hypothetical protein